MSGPAGLLGIHGTGPERIELGMGRRLHGAFGGVFGGGVAAATLAAARRRAPDRRPLSLHCTFTRGVTSDAQTASTSVLSTGRTLTSVTVDLHGDRSDAGDVEGAGGSEGARALAARSTATFADPESLHGFDAPGALPCPEVVAFDDGWELPLPEGVEAPVMDTLPMRITGTPAGGYAHTIRVPWEEHDGLAEAACMIADYCTGVPVGAAVGPEGTKIPVPNPDLSLRFVGDEWGEVLVGVGRLGRIDRGVAGTAVEVWSGPDAPWSREGREGRLVAIGLSSAVMLSRPPR